MDIVAGPFWYDGPEYRLAHAFYEPHPFDPVGYSDNFFAHVYDFNEDGRPDILIIGFPGETATWYENPGPAEGPWPAHVVFDTVDNDVITSLQAHGYGLAWFEHVEKDGAVTFVRHLVMNEKPEENRYGIAFAELHALDLVDMDGDGVKDIVTGKRWWSHGAEGDPDPNPKPYLYWFRTVRDGDVVDFVPYLIDDDTGVGVQVVTGDVNDDQLPDVVVSNKKGTVVLLQERRTVSKTGWRRAQPQPLSAPGKSH